MFDKPFTYDRTIRIILSLLIIGGLIWLLNKLSGVLVPFVVAVILAYLIDPFVSFFQKRFRGSRALGLIATTIIILLLHAAFYAILIPSLVNEYDTFSKIFNENKEYLLQAQFIPDNIKIWLTSLFQEGGVLSGEKRNEIIEKILPGLWSSLTDVMGFLMSIAGLLIIYLYLFFLLLEFGSFKENWHTYIPKKIRPQIIEFIQELNYNFLGYFRQKTLIVLINIILFAIAFSIMKLPLALLLAILLGLLNYIPYLQNLGIIPCILSAGLLSYETGNPFWIYLVAVLAIFIAVQLMEDAIWVPLLMREVTGMNPALMLLSISIWGSLMGILGMIIALPITALIITYYKKYILKEVK